ncbi:MAG: alpha/beta fold hydrolase [Candidatus Dojkabacteria bacterium]
MREKIIAAFAAVLIILCALPFIIILPQEEYRTAEQLASRNSSFQTIDGVKIHYEVYGDPVNPPVVLIHGFGGSTFTWRETIPFLQENKFYVIAIDLKGFGLSQKGLDLDYSHTSQAKMISELLKNLNVKDAVIVGHSMGANVAITLSIEHPDKVSKLILVDAVINKIDSNPLSQLSPLINVFPIEQYARQFLLRYVTNDKVKDILKSAYNDPELVTDDDVKGYSDALKMKDWHDSVIGIIRDSSKNNLSKSLDQIGKPVRIIWGLQDPWINIEDGKKINVDIKGSIMDVVEDAGHLPMEEKPSEFNAILLKDMK